MVTTQYIKNLREITLNFRLVAYCEILEELVEREHEEAFWDTEDVWVLTLGADCTECV